ncbi:Pentatricopeptide repeat-containing protein [Thalictrum thalictroides]|uniref:Pentatricopeptide repeat-containing protein n=1 Tax=Thalictrum thalictroides TaxID=46969 RepID=A0A7J6WBA0_THATH|nr:Pentatricopeptide repeat-containing protein [Thalictrum thalictroides]
MVCNRIKPDNFTYPFLINSCATLGMIEKGIEVHGRVVRTGFVSYLPVSNALIDMYGKCELLDLSYRVFDEMSERDVVSYNALLGAHARLGEDMCGAQTVFSGMPVRNVISWNAMIVGYVNAGDMDSARGIFDKMPEKNTVSWTTMLVGYTKNAILDMARVVFDSMPERNLVSWTAMITGYAQNGRPNEALSLFRRMETARMRPDAVTMTSVISASGQLGGSELAHWVESYVDREGVERNEIVLTALLDMHAKCGNIEEACRLFEEIPCPDVFPYSALITGLASHGHGSKALNVFQRMQDEGVEPDYITFVGVLTACSHAGLVEDGLRFWESMVKDYRIEPGGDHYACLIDMLGRAGKLDEAHEMVKGMPMGPNAGALGSLLAACKTYGNIEIAESVCKQLIKLEPKNTGNYVLLSNLYASRERWDEARQVREAMKDKRIDKLRGCSWID